jgi:phospholipid transport system substrate-binding protein
MANRVRFSLFLIIFLSFIAQAVSAMPGATAQVQGTVDKVIALLKNKELDRTERREMLGSLIRKRFDFRTMSRHVLAKNWKKATSDERKRFVSLFSDLLERTYMERLEAYTDEKVEYLNEKVKEYRAIVNTIIVTKSADIPIRYKMALKGDEWFIYDVVIEEVSLIRNYRSSYREIVLKEGIDGLLKRLEDKVSEMKKSDKRAKK